MTHKLGFLVVLGAATLPAGTARASDVSGFYAAVTRVMQEPPADPKEIWIFGAFAASGDFGTGDDYTQRSAGYLRFSCPAGQDAVCKLEWKDIAAAAGTANCVGFGIRSRTQPKVRTNPAMDPGADPYPVGGLGVVNTATGPGAGGGICAGLRILSAEGDGGVAGDAMASDGAPADATVRDGATDAASTDAAATDAIRAEAAAGDTAQGDVPRDSAMTDAGGDVPAIVALPPRDAATGAALDGGAKLDAPAGAEAGDDNTAGSKADSGCDCALGRRRPDGRGGILLVLGGAAVLGMARRRRAR
jgi:hypothetical protein